MTFVRREWLLLLCVLGCDPGSSPGDGGGGAGSGGQGGDAVGTIAISAGERTPIASRVLGLNYWMWSPTWGDSVAGTEADMARLQPGLLRIGGHNNDSNTPDVFDDAALDRAVAYATAVGAAPLLQVPLLSDGRGGVPTADSAAAMVSYANVTRGYGIQYFSIGNEPDLYPDQEPDLAGYGPTEYCAAVHAFVPAMRAVDPTIQIVGPDLSWKYRAGAQDWLTPILADCGDLFDIVAVHRYPLAPEQATLAAALGDAQAFRTDIDQLRAKLAASPRGDRPLAVTESNITYNGDPALPLLEASPGTVPAGLWAADALGVALESGLFAFDLWSISEGWTLGLIDPAGTPRPIYYALGLFAEHFGSEFVRVASAPKDVHAYASRTVADDRTLVIVINWTSSRQTLTVQVNELATPVKATFVLPALSVSALEMPDQGAASARVYSDAEYKANAPPSKLVPRPGLNGGS